MLKYKCTGIFKNNHGKIFEREYIPDSKYQHILEDVFDPETLVTLEAYAQFCFYEWLHDWNLLDIKYEEVD